MDDKRALLPPWNRAILGAAVAFAIVAFWPGVSWNVFVIAAASYFSLPHEHRTRTNAQLIGWSVGFGVVLLGVVWRVLAP